MHAYAHNQSHVDTCRAAASAFMKSAQDAASKETTSQLMRDIMTDATFDKQVSELGPDICVCVYPCTICVHACMFV